MSFPTTIESTSPLVNYTSSDWVPWEDEAGRHYRVARRNSSGMSFEFYGTGVTVQGRSTSAYQVQLDDGEPLAQPALKPEDRVLYSTTNLSASNHRLVLTSRANASLEQQLVGFDQAVIESPNDPTDMQTFFDNKNGSVFTYTGKWSLQSTKGVPNDTTTNVYHTTTENGASVSLSFTGTRTVSVRGVLDEDSGTYSVNMAGSSSVYNGSSSSLVPDALLFYRGGLDPQTSYTLVISNSDPAQKRLSVNTVVLHQISETAGSSTPTSSKKSIPKAAIIATSVVGAVLVFSIAFYYLYRRRRSSLFKSTKATKKGLPPKKRRRSHQSIKADLEATHLTEPPSLASSSFISQREPLQDAPESYANPQLTPGPSREPSPGPSTQLNTHNGRTTMSWSCRTGDSFTASDPLSPTPDSPSVSVFHPPETVWSEDESFAEQKQRPHSEQSLPTSSRSTSSRKPRPLPSVPSTSSNVDSEERDAGIYSETSLLRLLSIQSSSQAHHDPLAPPPRYERR